MNNLLQKVSYLKGLSDGLKIDNSNDEGRLLLETISVIEEIVNELDDINFRQDLIADDVQGIDEDLEDLESYVYDMDFDDFDDFDDFNDLDDFDFDDFDDPFIDPFNDKEELDGNIEDLNTEIKN